MCQMAAEVTKIKMGVLDVAEWRYPVWLRQPACPWETTIELLCGISFHFRLQMKACIYIYIGPIIGCVKIQRELVASVHVTLDIVKTKEKAQQNKKKEKTTCNFNKRQSYAYSK